MQDLRWQARIYIGFTLAVGMLFYLWAFLNFRLEHPLLLVALSLLAAITHTLKVEGATARSSYQLSWIAYGTSLVLLHPAETMVVLVVAHVTEWLWHRSTWYIALFNLATFGIIASLSSVLWLVISAGSTPFTLISTLGYLAAAATFTILNHLMVGLVIWLARGESLMRSGVFNALTLMIDFVNFGMGIASGLIWLVNPYAIIFILSPLYLIYTTLQVPSLQQQTRLEPKTGLYNTRFFSETLDTELERADKFGRPLTVIMADVDLLRNINNNYGHLAGDTVLIGIANLLRDFVRDYDIVARFGGEEYAILMPETTLANALPLVEKLRATIATTKFDVSTSVEPIGVTMSFGVAEREFHGQTAEQIIHNADLAVYRSKSTTRNRVCFFEGDEIKDYSQGEAPKLPANADSETHQLNAIPPLVATAKQQPSIVTSNGTGAQNFPKLEPTLINSTQTARPLRFRETKNHALALEKGTTSSANKPTKKAVPRVARAEWLSTIYITLLGLLAIGGVIGSLTFSGAPNWSGIIVFTIFTLLTEWLAIDIYTRNTSISTSAAPLLAGACLFGPIGALVISLALSTSAMIKHRSPFIRYAFNTSNHLLASLTCIYFLFWTNISVTTEVSITIALSMIAAAGLTYLSTTILMSGIIHLSSGIPAREIWTERFSWLWPYYIVLGLVAYALALGYLNSGIIGVTIFFAPLLMLRISQDQYLSRTESMVTQLRTVNRELVERSNEISAMNDGLILALSRASDLRDPYVHGHAQHVARYAVLIAQEIGLHAERIQSIEQAALLHDIGKIGIPETILFKPARLTDDEYELMKQHAALGAALVQEIESLQHLAPFIRYHHEFYNGHGYPDGLAGDQIPLEARIISAADAIEAMASDRPYRSALDAVAILSELEKHSGTQFDPRIVESFTKIIQAQGERLIVNSARDISQIIEQQGTALTSQESRTPEYRTISASVGEPNAMQLHSELDTMNIALQRAIAAHRRLEISAQEGRDLAETLLKVASTINMTLDHDRVLTVILEQLAYVMDYDNASIMLLEGDTLNSVARRSIHVPESESLSVPVRKLMHVQEVMETRRAVVIGDTHDDHRWMRRAGSENIRCWLGIPLLVQNRIIGLMNLSNGVPGYYTERHIEVATAFAAHASIAIENARLFTQAQNEIAERKRAEKALQEERSLLAQRVEERTSELRDANEQLTAALRTKDEFLATMSHELRTPLSAIMLLSESMQNGVYGTIGDRQISVLDNVKRSAHHLLSLINDILDMSKIEAGMFDIDVGPVSAVAICRNSLQIVEEAARGKGIELVQSFDPTVQTVSGDERRLAQILVNLLSNAIKFTPDDGKVGLEVVNDPEKEMVNFIVWDTGIGISEEDKQLLFQPFVQLDSKLSRLYEGTGLGLALVDRLTKLHGGEVSLESEVGKGSRFYVSIPRREEEEDDFLELAMSLLQKPQKDGIASSFEDAQRRDGSDSTVADKNPTTHNVPSPNEPSEEDWLATIDLDKIAVENTGLENGAIENIGNDTVLEVLTEDILAEFPENGRTDCSHNKAGTEPVVLLVEDNEIGIEAMHDYLSANHYQILVARNGEDAIYQATMHKPNIILMDIQMPDMDGLEATRKIRENAQLAHTPIIALTALAMPGDRERCLQAGVNAYLSKPVSMKHLLNVMAQLQKCELQTV